jgi:hypothetical protein
LAYCDDGKISRLTRPTTVTLRFPCIHNEPPTSSRFTCDNTRNIRAATTSRSPIGASASSSIPRRRVARSCDRNGTRATPGRPPGRRTAKGYFRISLTLGGRKRILRAHRTVLRIDRAGLSRKVRNGPIPHSAPARRTPWACRCGRSPAKPGRKSFATRAEFASWTRRSGHARDETTEVLLSDRTSLAGARRATEVVASCFEW